MSDRHNGPSSRSEQLHPGSRSDQSHPRSTSPRIERKGKTGEPRTKTGSTPNGTAGGARESSKRFSSNDKALPRTPAGVGNSDTKKLASPGALRKHSSTSALKPASGGGVMKPASGGTTTDKSCGRASATGASKQTRNTQSPTGEDGKKQQKSTPEKRLSPLTQKRATVGQAVSRKASSSPDEAKSKKSTPSSSPGAIRRTAASGSRPARSSVTQTDGATSKGKEEAAKVKKSSPALARKPPSGAASAAANGRSSSTAPKQSASSKLNSNGKVGGVSRGTTHTDGGKSNGQNKAGSRGGSPTEKKGGEKDKKASDSGGNPTGEKKVAGTGRKSVTGGRESPWKERKVSVEKRPGSGGSSPGSERKAGATKRQGGSSASPGVPQKSNVITRVGSGGSTPVSQRKTSSEKKPGSASPGTTKRVSSEKKAGSASPRKVSTEKRLSSGSSGSSGGSSPARPRKTSAETDGVNPRSLSVRSRSVVTLGTGALSRKETRKISAAAAISPVRGSPSPSTGLSGKVVTLDPLDLHGEDRLQSTLKLFGVRGAGAGGVKKTQGKGPVIKSMGMGGASAGSKSVPIRKISSPRAASSSIASKTGVTRTGSGSIVRKPSPKTGLTSRDRLHSSDDVLKTGRRSPADVSSRLTTVPSPLSQTAKSGTSKTRGSGAAAKRTEKERVGSSPPSKAGAGGKDEIKTDGSGKSPSLAVERVKKTGLVSRPSCRDTKVKSRIANWSKKENEAMEMSVSPCLSPVPPSPRSPNTPNTASPLHSPHNHAPHSSSASPSSSPHISPATSPSVPLDTSPVTSPSVPLDTSPVTSPSVPLDTSPHASPSASPHTSSHPSPRASVSPSPLTSPQRKPLSSPQRKPLTSLRASSLSPRSSPLSSPKRQRSSSPVVVPSPTPVKSRIALWAEKEKEAKVNQKSVLPQPSSHTSLHSSPECSPQVSPKLRRQSPIDRHRSKPVSTSRSPSRSPAHSGGSSELRSKANSASPPRQIPEIKVGEKEEGGEIEEEVYEDIIASPKKTSTKNLAPTDDDLYEDVVTPKISPSRKSENGADEVYEDVVAKPKEQQPVSEPCITREEDVTETAPPPPLIQEDIYSTIPEMYQNFPKGNDRHLESNHEAPRLPPRPGSLKDKSHSVPETDMHVYDIEEDTAVYDDVNVGGSPSKNPAKSEVYTEIPILEENQPASVHASNGNVLKKSVSNLTPKSKRKWLRSPLFGRRKGSTSDDKDHQLEGANSDREREDKEEKKKDEGFIRRFGKIGSRSSKERKATKRKSASIDGLDGESPLSSAETMSKTSYDSDSEGTSSREGSQVAIATSELTVAPKESRTRSTSDIAQTEQLAPQVIPRSSSYSPSAKPDVEYVVITRKKLDPVSQRVISSVPDLTENSQEEDASNAAYMVATHKKLDPATQRVVSDQAVSHESSPKKSSDSATGGTKQLLAKPSAIRKSASVASSSPNRGRNNRSLSGDILSIIHSMEGSEFLEQYSRKLTPPPPWLSEASGSAPTGLRLPVPFELKPSTSHPNLVSVGFQVPQLVLNSNGRRSSQTLPNGVAGGRVGVGVGEREGVSDSSTGSEGEDQGSPGPEKEEEGNEGEEDMEREEDMEGEEDDIVCPIESSLDRGRLSRHEIKRKLSEKSLVSPDAPVMTEPPSTSNPNQENLVVTSLMYADAVWDRVGLENDELSFRVGDVIEILDMSDDTWWQGSVEEHSGWFPSSFVRLRIAQDEEEEDVYSVVPPGEGRGSTLPRMATMPAGDPTYATYGRTSNSKRRMTIRRKDSCPSMPRKLTPSEVRSKVVEEILNTERDYVKHLEDIIEGFQKKCRLNTKLFDSEKVETIFSNVEALYVFQRHFLGRLEARVNPAHMEDSQIGEVFVSCRDQFGVYSEYCNNHPHAVNEMCTLQKKEQYAFFFESCRLLRNLQDIPLEGFLLLPVQRICKYPLQLSELLKYTSEDHPDRPHVEASVHAMKQVAMHINEGKRRLENIGRIGKWQETIENWKGADIVETCTEMVHSGELHKISKGHSQERHFFLFDNHLIYCKKDAIGGKLSYKGRLSMEMCTVTDLPDGKETHNGAPVKNAWKMDNRTKGKDYVIYAKTSEAKEKWMDAFERARERVIEDRENGFNVSLKMKRAAASLSSSSTTRVTPAKRRRSFNKKQTYKVQALSESVDSGVKLRLEGSPAREKKGKFSIMGLNF